MPNLFLIGAGPGVSASVARRFGGEGFRVVAFARRAAALEQQVQALREAGIDARAQQAGASDLAGLALALGHAAAAHGEPDVLVYNAAGARYKPLADLSAAELMADLQVSVGGALAAVQAVLPAMRARGRGTLLLTGGGFAFEPMPPMASLGAGKAALRNLAFSLHADLAPAGIHAGTVTICGTVKPGTAFDPDRIADSFWALHAQPAGSFEREVMVK